MIPLLYFILFLLASFSIGRRIIKLFKLNLTFSEEIVFGVSLGYFVLAYTTFFLGVFGFLYRSIFYVIFSLGVFASLFELKYLKENVKRGFSKLGFGLNLQSVLMIILLFFVIINLVASMSPPWDWDALSYHLAVPKTYIRERSIVYIPSLLHSNMPFFSEMLYLFGLVLYGGVLAKLIAYSFVMILALAVISFSKRYFNLEVGLLGALIFYLVPNVMEDMVRIGSGMSLTLFCFLAFYAFVMWYNKPNMKWLILAAIMIGSALSIKYLAAMFFLPLLFFLLVRLTQIKHKKIWYKLFSLLLFCLVSFLIFVPWLAKNYVYTGNPVFPFLYNVFGGKYLNGNMFVELTLQSTGINIKDYILLPWNLTMHSLRYDSDLLGTTPIFLAFIPLLIFIKRKKNNALKLCLYFSVSVITIWFLLNVNPLRHLIPVFALLSIVSAFVIHELLFYKSKVLKSFILIILLSSLVFSLSLWAGMSTKYFPVVLGFESEQEFHNKLKDHSPYDASMFINKNTPLNSKVLLVGDSRGYFIDRDYDYDQVGIMNYIDYSGFENDQDFVKRLRELNITHILFNSHFYNETFKTYNREVVLVTPRINNLFTNLTTKHSEKVYDKKGVMVFELK